MVTVLSETQGDLLALRVSGKFTNGDFDQYRELVRERVKAYGKVRLYFEMIAFNGWRAESFLETGMFDLIHRREFQKVAMVGEKEWQRWAALAADVVKAGKVQYFPLSERWQAMQWLQTLQP